MSIHSPGGSNVRSRPGKAVVPLVLVTLLWGGVETLSAQVAGRDQPLEPVEALFERPTEISPRSGPPGTEVRVKGLHLPAITPVNIAFGGTRSGFEGLSFILTDRHGEVEEVVKVPEWAGRDRIHRFIIFDAYFDPISMTELFHVTDENGRIQREGEVVEAGPRCALVAGQDQDAYYLLGRTEGLEVGAQVAFEAAVEDSSECGEGTHVRVVRLDRRP